MKGLFDDIIEATGETTEGLAQDLLFDLMDIVEKELNKPGSSRTRKWLADKAGMKEPQLSRLLRSEGNPNIRTIAKIFKALDIKPKLSVRQKEKDNRTKFESFLSKPMSAITASDKELKVLYVGGIG